MNDLSSDVYRTSFRNATIGMAISDEQGRVVDANDYLLIRGGWTREEVRGMMASDFYEGPVQRREIIDKAMRQGGLNDQPVRFKTKDGRIMPALMSLRQDLVDGRRYLFVYIREDENASGSD